MLNVNSIWLLTAGAGLQAAGDVNHGEALPTASTELVWNYDILGRLCILFDCGLAAKEEPPAALSQNGCDRANAVGTPPTELCGVMCLWPFNSCFSMKVYSKIKQIFLELWQSTKVICNCFY